MGEFNFRKLIVYQKAICYVNHVYDLIAKFPREEQYAICDQLRRAAVSVPSNIAEGMNRGSAKEQLHFLNVSYSSLMETLCQFEISLNRKYINEQEWSVLESEISELSKLLGGLTKSLTSKL